MKSTGNILITGSSGFIGYHLTKNVCSKFKKNIIVGIDNINNYYDVNLKIKRNKDLKNLKNFVFFRCDILKKKKIHSICKKYKVKTIIHLAAQAGVRYSIQNPKTYLDNNIIATFNILEIARDLNIKHCLIASTSSVYGTNNKFPLKENFNTDTPLSFYAATKKSCEVLAHSFSNIYKLPITMLRFFTVYGTLGRPDMALHKFTKAIYSKSTLSLFNNGNHTRDFTHVNDVTNLISIMIKKTPKKKIPYEVYNLGGGKPKKLSYFLKLIEKNTRKKTKLRNLPLQKGDVIKTHASIKKIFKSTKYKHKISIEKGIKEFVSWFKNFYQVK